RDGGDCRPVFVIGGREVPVPDTATELLENVWTMLAAGEEVTITAAKNEIRTGEAAKLLNISRQYLVRLCEEGKLPYRIDGDGKHRRLARQDVLAYRRQRDEARRASFRKYVAEVAASGEYDIPVTWEPQG
ncbi:MAG TPA: helix-turn-helix domain-containing protein, partial [Trueperaceae bacterium]|nr:helix-turn-helix domain-containing protein [Trueperaceae bacterium]